MAQRVVEHPLSGIEYVFYGLGLDSPIKRLLFGAALTESLVYLAKPGWAFVDAGIPREWSVFSSDENATSTPWWGPGILVGIALAIFI